MEMTGSKTIAAEREMVWAALNNADVLKDCIPGCEELTGSPETGFEAKVTQKVGPVKAKFAGAVQLSDVVPLESYTISGEGKRKWPMIFSSAFKTLLRAPAMTMSPRLPRKKAGSSGW